MPNARPTLWSLIGVVLTLAALALIIYRVAGGGVPWWLTLALLVLSILAFSRR
jgi:hypothetical protein